MACRFIPRTALLLLFVILRFALRAGDSDKGIGVTLLTYTVDSNNTVDLGYTITINAQVTNFDTSTFDGVLNFGLRSNTDTLTNAGIFGQPPYSGDMIHLAGGETVPAIFSVNVNYQYFAPGPDVVVVWPICSQPIADSILINVTVVKPDPSGINPLAGNIFSYAVLSDRILLQGQLNFKQVRILDILGQEVYLLNSNNIAQIQLPVLPKGIYICQLLNANGQKLTFKFFH